MAISCIISEIKQGVGRKSRFFNLLSSSQLVDWSPHPARRNITVRRTDMHITQQWVRQHYRNSIHFVRLRRDLKFLSGNCSILRGQRSRKCVHQRLWMIDGSIDHTPCPVTHVSHPNLMTYCLIRWLVVSSVVVKFSVETGSQLVFILISHERFMPNAREHDAPVNVERLINGLHFTTAAVFSACVVFSPHFVEWWQTAFKIR